MWAPGYHSAGIRGKRAGQTPTRVYCAQHRIALCDTLYFRSYKKACSDREAPVRDGAHKGS